MLDIIQFAAVQGLPLWLSFAAGLVYSALSRRLSPAGGFLFAVIPGAMGLVANIVLQEFLDGFWTGCLAVSSISAIGTLLLCNTAAHRRPIGVRIRVGKRAIPWVAAGLVAVLLTGFGSWKAWCAVAPTNYAVPGYVTDFRDDRKLAGFADDIFFGRVERKTGQTNDDFPSTQFQVLVLDTLKGDTSGSIIVSQEGGTGRFCFKFRLADDPHLMEPGKEYLLFTKRVWDFSNWHYVLSGFGKYEVTGPEDTERLRERFAEAIKNEIPISLSGSQ